MKQVQFAPLLLRARLAIGRAGAAACVAGALCLAGAAALAWLAPQREQLAASQRKLEQERNRPPAPAALVSAPPPSDDANLAAYYGVLGEKRYAEQHVKVLFGLAAKAGLTLRQGEYKFGYDKASRVTTYQVTLPVNGGYPAIWQFAIDALRALPFAALDDIGFKRDSIKDTQVEARLRFTLYLHDPLPEPPPGPAVQGAQAGTAEARP